MSHSSVSAAAVAAAPVRAGADSASAIVEAARLLLPHLERGRPVDAAMLRAAMESAFGASDADGTWTWKTAYDACEAATVLFLRKFGPAMRAKAASPAAMHHGRHGGLPQRPEAAWAPTLRCRMLENSSMKVSSWIAMRSMSRAKRL